MDTLTSDGA